MTNTTSISYVLSALVALGALSPAVHAGDRLHATGGVTQVEGSAGGG